MGYNKCQTQFTADTSTWYCVPQVSSYIVIVTRPTGNPGYSAHITGLTATTSPVIQYPSTGLPNVE